MSKSQLYVKIVSILNIIGGAFRAIIGLLGSFGASIMGDAALIQKAGDESAPLYVKIFVVAMVVSGAFSIFCGVLGLRAVKDASKVKPVLILAGLALLIEIGGLISNIVGNNFSAMNLLTLVPPCLMLICAINIRKQA